MVKSSALELFSAGDISAQTVAEKPRRRQDLRFIAQGFARTSLPYQQPKPGTMSWTRRNGKWTLTVQPGMTQDEHGNEQSIGFPSGTIPRLITCWFATEAVKHKKRKLDLGASITEFMAEIGIRTSTSSGGEKGMNTQLKSQFERLCQASVSLRYGGDPNRQAGARASVASEYELYWSKNRKGQVELLPSTVTLSEEFFETCTVRPVPVDMNTIQKLHGSAMRIDQYWWLTHKMSYLEEPCFVPFEAMGMQFGSDVSTRQAARSFAKNFSKNLELTLEVYDKAGARIIENKGVLLLPGGTDIRPSQSRELELLEKQWREDRTGEPPF